jgi:hypothetical protein
MKRIIQGPLNGFDLGAEFHTATGLTLEEYRDLVFATLTWYESQDQETLLSNPGVLQIHRSKYISNSHITQEQFDNYLALDSVKLTSLPEKVREHRDKMNEQKEKIPPVLPQYDFTVFRRWPLLELHNGNLICLAPSFLIEKLDIGFHWTILNSLSDKRKRDRALQAFGHLFELYVDRLLSAMHHSESNLFLSFPSFLNGNESFDSVVCIGDHLIVMEYKGGSLTQAAKYSGKLKHFEADLDRKKKFGVGSGAGVYQLAAKIERLFHSDRSRRESIPELSSYLNRIVKITPILIVQEPFLRFDFMNWMLNNRFQKLIKQKQVSRAIEVAPLQLIDIDSLERIKVGVQAGAFRFDQCINWRAFDDPDLVSSFATYPWSQFFPGFNELSDSEVEERLDSIIERIKRYFFGE